MASAKKCDRCGTLYEGKEISKKLKGFNYEVVTSCFNIAFSGSHYTETFDLCPKCSEKYEKFLTGGDPDDE
jgi:hypothetical protein